MERINARSFPASTVVRGPDAHAALKDVDFLSHWAALHRQCPHATAFQTPRFVCGWYAAYRDVWEPVIAESRDAQGALTFLWLLAYQPGTRVLTHAGAHQAEYHAWLALAGEDSSLLAAAWSELANTLAFSELRCKYLPAMELADTLQAALGSVSIRRHIRPLLRLNTEQIRASFAKKSNKSRFNRLKKLGKLEFRRITDPLELARVFDELIDFYDFRQSAVNHSTPFREDSRKRGFHLDLFSAAPEEVFVTATFLDDRPIAAFWGEASGPTVHLGMLVHSPFLAEHSPGKLHVMQLSEHLLQVGRTVLDLTPGGDAWKERFADDHDEVAEAILHTSMWGRRRAETVDALARHGKQWLGRIGVTPDQVRAGLALLRRAKPAAVIRKIRRWANERREFRVYRGDHALAQRYTHDPRVRCNDLGDLLLFQPGESWQSRDGFLSSALARLEEKQSAYTIRLDGRLAHCGWLAVQSKSHMTEVEQSMTFPPGSVALYDFYTSPDFRGRGLYRATIGHMLQAAFAREDVRYAYISVLADNGPSRHVIESMGFEYQGSFHWRRRVGRVTKWADADLLEPEHA